MVERPLRIIHILCGLERGGAERVVLDLCRHTPPAQAELHVATVMGGGPLEQSFREAGFSPFLAGRRPRRLGMGSVWRLVHHLRILRPDIVHTHLFAGDVWGHLAAALSPRPRPHLISTEHNLNREESHHHRLMKRILSSHVDRIIAVSRAVADHAVIQEGLPREKITVIHNGVDLKHFTPRAIRTPGPGNRLVAIGRLVRQKGFDLLLKALIAEPDWQLTLVGDGPMRAQLQAQVLALGLTGRVQLLGDQADVRPFLMMADVLVQPSRWEGFGLVVLEGMAMGLPVLVAASDGLTEVVEHGRSGWLVPPGSTGALVDGLRTLTRDSALRGRLGLGALSRARDFGIEETAAAYLAVYRTLHRQIAGP